MDGRRALIVGPHAERASALLAELRSQDYEILFAEGTSLSVTRQSEVSKRS
jgi:hypothetical protein